MMKFKKLSKKHFLILLSLVATVVLLFPKREICGTAAGYSCAMPPIEPGGYASYHYSIQPFGISLLEMITQTNIEWFEYSTGTVSY